MSTEDVNLLYIFNEVDFDRTLGLCRIKLTATDQETDRVKDYMELVKQDQ